MRLPIAEGSFYAAEKRRLISELDACFRSRFFAKGRAKNIKACIVPHGGLMYSGPCMASVYNLISGYDLYLIIGTDHAGNGTGFLNEGWKTVFGAVKTDKDFIGRLKKAGFKENKTTHYREHSIEVQLPFLQYINKKSFKIAALNIAADSEFIENAKMLFKALKGYKKKVCIICTSDFIHYGFNYGFEVADGAKNARKAVKQFDMKAFGYTKKFKAFDFLSLCEQRRLTICGRYGIAALIELLKLMKVKKSELLSYYNTGDITGNYDNFVSYAAMVFY